MNHSPYTEKLGIKMWAEEDRPREKLLLKGKLHLTDAELLAILIGSGSRTETAVDLCKRILKEVGNNLHELGKMRVEELLKFKGIGTAKAVTIVAAMELSRRKQSAIIQEKQQITTSRDGFLMMQPLIGDLPHEEFWILLLNRANKVIAKKQLSQGGITGTVADSRLIFRQAIDLLATSIILCHNHPSGNLKPSQADIALTRRLVKAGKLLEITVLDHLIVTNGGYYSFADEGMMSS